MRPMMRPGLRLLRRDTRTYQLGLEWPGSALVADTPAVRAVLSACDGFRDTDAVLARAVCPDADAAACGAALTTLITAGALVDADEPADPPAPSAGALAAWWLRAGPSATARDLLRARQRLHVEVRGDGVLASAVRACLDEAQVGLADEGDSGDLVVLAFDHEPPRDDGDGLMRTGRPHLWVHLRDLVGVVGPLVRPATTACLRCVDAARANLDRTWPTILASYLASAGAGHAVDPVLVRGTSAWAAALIGHCATPARQPPSAALPDTATSTVAELSLPYGVTTHTYDVHPQCGCRWPVWRATMGA